MFVSRRPLEPASDLVSPAEGVVTTCRLRHRRHSPGDSLEVLLFRTMSSGDFGAGGFGGESPFVGDHHPPDVIREASLKAAHGLVAGLSFGDLLVEVSATDAVAHPDLGDRDEVGLQS